MNMARRNFDGKTERFGGSDVVVAHDYLTQKGGAERVALELVGAVNANQIATALYSPERTFSEFGRIGVIPSWLNAVPTFRADPRKAFPLLAGSWSRRRALTAKAVICSSSGWAHGMPVLPTTKKIVYCHNPARWLHQPEDYFLDQGLVPRSVVAVMRSKLIAWDRRAAESATVYIANSSSVAARVKAAYGRDAIVVFPPISVDVDGEHDCVRGLTPGKFFLTVGRARGYKGTNAVIEAFSALSGTQLAVVGGYKPATQPTSNVHCLGMVSEAKLRWLYRNARALVSVSKEDFGLTPIEANAFGTPVLVLRAGGFLDSTDEGISGLFLDNASPESIRRMVEGFPQEWDRGAVTRHSQKFSATSFREKIGTIVQDALEGRYDVRC